MSDETDEFPVVPGGGDTEEEKEKLRGWRYAVHYGMKKFRDRLTTINEDSEKGDLDVRADLTKDMDLLEDKIDTQTDRITDTRDRHFALEKKLTRWLAFAAGAGAAGAAGFDKLIGWITGGGG